jgi:quinol-cytochrome oxidoreductase complex cytochrome b subunit
LGGVVAMLAAILVFMLLPYINTSEIRSSNFRPLYKIVLSFFIIDVLILGWIGGNVVEYPYIEIGQIATFFYFFILLAVFPALGVIETNINRKI